MGLFSIKKKAPFEPAVEDLSAVYGADSHIVASEFVTIGKDAENMESIVRPSVSFWKDAMSRVGRSKVAVVCLAILVLLILGAIFIPIFSPFTISQQDVTFIHKPPFSIDPSSRNMHIFGTDLFGRDIFVRL